MKTTSRGSEDEKRVGDGMVDIANLVGPPTTGSLSVGGTPSDPTDAIEGHKEEKALAGPTSEEDGISPDDAPEVVLGDTDEDGEEDTPNMFGRLGRPQTAADAMKAMQGREDEEVLLRLGTLSVAGNQEVKNPVRRKDDARSQNNRQKKSNKKKKDRRLIEESIHRMRISTASSRSQKNSELRVPRHGQITTPLRSGLDQEVLDRPVFKASATETPCHVLSLQGRSGPIMFPPVNSITTVYGPSVRFADSDNTTFEVDLGTVERAAISGGPETVGAEDKKVPLLAQIKGAVGVSPENVDNVIGTPLIKAHSDENGPYMHTNTTSSGADATQRTAAERGKARVQVSTQAARLRSGSLVGAPTDSHPRGLYDPNIEADQMDAQVDFSTHAMDKDDDKEPPFGVLSTTTFHPLLAYQPQLDSHGFNVEENDPIIEDIDSGFVTDSVMEDARTESWQAAMPVTATRTLQPFSWVPPPTSGAFHAIFPGAPFANTRTTGIISDSLPAFQHRTINDPYAVDMATSEEAIMQHAGPPQDIAWPFVLGGTVHPLPSVEVGLSQGLQSNYAKYSLTSGPSVFATQSTSHSPIPSPSRPPSRVDPVPVLPSTCRHIEVHVEEVNDLEGEFVPEPVIAASAQREVSPLRSFHTHKVVGLAPVVSQWCTRPSPTNPDTSFPRSSPPFDVGTTAFSHLAPSPVSPIEHEDENGHCAKDGYSEEVQEIVYPTLAIARPGTKKSAPPIVPAATSMPSPPIPPRVAGSKRIFVEDRGTRYNPNSINPARKVSDLPLSKKPKLKHGDYSTHKRLGEVKAMHRREGEGTKLPEAIKFATRHAIPSSDSPAKSGEAPDLSA